LEVNVTKAPDSRLITDGYDPHNTDAIKRWLTAWPRFHVHFTRISVSWQERVEGRFSKAAERCIHRGTHRSTPFLDQAIRQLIDLNTEDLRPFVLTEAADDILASLERIGRRSSPSGHSPSALLSAFPYFQRSAEGHSTHALDRSRDPNRDRADQHALDHRGEPRRDPQGHASRAR
jgi:hypothetical protein